MPADAWLRSERLPTATELDVLAEKVARLAPVTLPDGRPFPGARNALRLRRILRVADQHVDATERWELRPCIRRLLTYLGNPEVADADGTSESTIVRLSRTGDNAKAILVRHGLQAEAAELGTVVDSLVDYYRLRSRGEESLPDAS